MTDLRQLLADYTDEELVTAVRVVQVSSDNARPIDDRLAGLLFTIALAVHDVLLSRATDKSLEAYE